MYTYDLYTLSLYKSFSFKNFITLYFLFGGTGVQTQGFKLAGQVFYHLSHSASPKFTFEIYEKARRRNRNRRNI
jgi:hypothetical protein